MNCDSVFWCAFEIVIGAGCGLLVLFCIAAVMGLFDD